MICKTMIMYLWLILTVFSEHIEFIIKNNELSIKYNDEDKKT